jgi:glycosyltransferase 2 family protein
MKLALQLAVSIAAVALLLVYVVDVREVAAVLRGFPAEYALLALLVATLDRVLMSYKWAVLVHAQGYRLSSLHAMTMYCAAMLWGSALPATVGADAVRAVLATKSGIRSTDVVASIIVERVVGFVWALVLGIVCLFVLRSAGVLDGRYDLIVFGSVAMLAGAIAIVLVSMNRPLMARAARLLPSRVQRTRLVARLGEVARASQSLGASRRAIAEFSALTVLEQVFALTLPLTLAIGLGVDLHPIVLMAIVPVAMLISRLPVSFDGLGIFEALFVGLFVLAGVSPEASFAIAIAGRVVQLIAVLPWWLVQVTWAGSVRPPPLQSRDALKIPPA